MSVLFEYYVQTPDGRRECFKDIKQANEYAQMQANAHKETIVRYDIHGGQSWFRPEAQ